MDLFLFKNEIWLLIHTRIFRYNCGFDGKHGRVKKKPCYTIIALELTLFAFILML